MPLPSKTITQYEREQKAESQGNLELLFINEYLSDVSNRIKLFSEVDTIDGIPAFLHVEYEEWLKAYQEEQDFQDELKNIARHPA